MSDRVVRLVLPASLIREMDDTILSGAGGYADRSELVQEALRNHLLELRYPPADEPRSTEAPGTPKQESLHLSQTAKRVPEALALPNPPVTVNLIEPENAVDGEPLFGLHNRDFPSLWALSQIAVLTESAAQRIDEVYGSVLSAAWRCGEELRTLDSLVPGKPSALFPTNRDKPQSAEAAFRTFALGVVDCRSGGLTASGPLFAWGVCGVLRGEGTPRIGLTSAGIGLLHDLAGMTVVSPHPEDRVRRFAAFLQEHAPQDWWGFHLVLRAASDGISRSNLVAAFRSARLDWTDTEANTYAAGYVARAREWGLLEPKQQHGLYLCSELGREYAER